MKRKHPVHENHERWLVSYADFITLLFAFFVVMFASSQTDRSKAKQISQAVEKALENGKSVRMTPAVAKVLGGTVDDRGTGNNQMKGPGGVQHAAKEAPQPPFVAELTPALRRLGVDLEKEIQSGAVELKLEPRGLVISLRQSAFFPSGTDELDTTSFDTIGKIAAVLRSMSNQIQLEGHTDSIPIHNARFRSNWELSSARAIAMLDLLTERFEVSPSRFSVVGRADTSPVDSNDSESGRQRNRRVDVVIVNPFNAPKEK